MRKFEFAPPRNNLFTGFAFYMTYKDSAFLRVVENVNRILTEAHQLRQGIKDLQPGDSLQITGMNIKHGIPLIVKKGGPNVVIEDTIFTMNRLTGLTAAYVYDNRKNYHDIESAEAKALGLTWTYQDNAKARLYLACVSGTEHFLEQFSFVPLVCSLRKVHLGKIKPEFVTKIAKIKNANGITMSQMLQANFQEARRYWSHFPGSTPNDFKQILAKFEQ